MSLSVYRLSAWFAAKKLSLNISKAKFMVFRPRQKRLCYDNDISINGEALTQVSEALFLSVLLDDCLSWKSHISLVAHKISKSGIIYRSSYSFLKPRNVLYIIHWFFRIYITVI